MRYSNKSNDHFYNNKENILFFKKNSSQQFDLKFYFTGSAVALFR